MRNVLGLLISITLAGCGKEDSGSKGSTDPMVALWYVEKNYSDFEVFNIKANGTYRYTVAESSGNTYEMQQTDGELSYDGTTLTITPKRSTCETREKQEIAYTQKGDSLTLTIGSTSIVFARSEEDTSEDDGESGSVVFTTGCFDAETGDFTAREWADL